MMPVEKNSDPVISIIVPVYNVEKYLENCIISVLNQTFSDFELILVDDGSTDSSKEICQSFSENDARIRFITYPDNKGMSYARNRGMDTATGEYLFFLDSDDMIHPQLLTEMLKQAEDFNLDMVMTEFAMSKFKNGAMVGRPLQGTTCSAMEKPFRRWTLGFLV